MKLFATIIAGALLSIEAAFALPTPTAPILVPSPTGRTNCVISNGALICWGANDAGQLGDGSFFTSTVPQVIIPAGVTSASISGSIDEGVGHGCAVVTGILRCWGDNSYYQLGDGTQTRSLTPKTIPVGTGLVPATVSVGVRHTCVTFADKSAKCWGDNEFGQLGQGVTGDIPHPTNESAPPLNWSAANAPLFRTGSTVIKTISMLRAGNYHSCALFGTTPRCWGDNQYGQIGNGDADADTTAPVNVVGGVDDDGNPVALTGTVTSLKVGGYHSCLLVTTATATNTLRCWGQNGNGQLGSDQGDTAYALVSVGSDVTNFEVGTYHTCIIRFGGLKCFGSGEFGKLGNGTEEDSLYPQFVTDARAGVTNVMLGFDSSCATFGTTNVVKCWGNNEYGQVGDGVLMQEEEDGPGNPDYPLVFTPTTVAWALGF